MNCENPRPDHCPLSSGKFQPQMLLFTRTVAFGAEKILFGLTHVFQVYFRDNLKATKELPGTYLPIDRNLIKKLQSNS
jgi:hypothetical protein